MKRYGSKEYKKALENHLNSTIWSAMDRYDKCFVLFPTMKPLD